MTSHALSLSSLIRDIISFSVSGLTIPLFMAVDTIPVPIGLVRIRASPGLAPELEIILPGSIFPVTTNPNFGSLSSMV